MTNTTLISTSRVFLHWAGVCDAYHSALVRVALHRSNMLEFQMECVCVGGGKKKKGTATGSRERRMRRRRKKRGGDVFWAKLRSIVAFFSPLLRPELLPVSPRGLLPVWLIAVSNPHCSYPPYGRGGRRCGGGMTSGPHQTSGPCPKCKNTTQCFDVLLWEQSSRPGRLVNMPMQLYCLIMRVLFYVKTGALREGERGDN